MRIRRKGRPPTRGAWTKESSAKAHAAKARKRMESPRDPESRRVPEGEYLYTIQIQESSGQVRKWVIRQGTRANNIVVTSKGKSVVCGWDKLMRSLRHNLSVTKRLFT